MEIPQAWKNQGKRLMMAEREMEKERKREKEESNQ